MAKEKADFFTPSMMIVNYHGFFRVHRHYYADHADHRSNYASHCSD